MIRDGKLQVIPMLTDPGRWTEEDIKTYARLLHVRPNDILKEGKDDLFSNGTRGSYFCDFGEHDLFLDPDTGIAPKKARKEHISFSEIATLLSKSKSRMLLIYQHASRNKAGLREKLKLLRKAEGLEGCHMFAYDSGAVSMVVISRNRERTDRTRDRFKSWLGPIASTRIIP
jgi:hypothetical protein